MSDTILTPNSWVFSVTGAVMQRLMLPGFHVFSIRLTCELSGLCVPAGLIRPLFFVALLKEPTVFLPAADNLANVITRLVIMMRWA